MLISCGRGTYRFVELNGGDVYQVVRRGAAADGDLFSCVAVVLVIVQVEADLTHTDLRKDWREMKKRWRNEVGMK